MKKKKKKKSSNRICERHERALAEMFNPLGPAPVSPAGLGLPADSLPALANSLEGGTKSPKCLVK